MKSMLRLIPSLAVALAIGTATTTDSQAQNIRVGTVDMNRAFSEFHKTKDASNKIQDDIARVRTELNEREAALRKLIEEAQQLEREAQDTLLAQEVRQQKVAAYTEKANEVRSLQQQIAELQRRRQLQIQEEQARMRKALYDEILAVVERKTSEGQYDLVFDRSGVSLTQIPFLLHAGAAIDFTDTVITELNKDAPAEAAAAPAAAP